MAVTIAAVIENACLSRHQKAEFVTSRSSIQTLASFTHLAAQKPDQAPVDPVYPALRPDLKIP
jgi:hypothetical protein